MDYEECLEVIAMDLGWDSFDDARNNHFHLNTLVQIMCDAAELYKEQ